MGSRERRLRHRAELSAAILDADEKSATDSAEAAGRLSPLNRVRFTAGFGVRSRWLACRQR